MGYTPHNPLDKANLILDLIAKKQQTTSANLANVHTPGYQRQEVNFEQYLGVLNSPLETKLAQKLGPSPLTTTKGGEVSATKEMIDMQKNLLFYTLATRRVTSIIQELRTIAQLGR